MYGSVPDLSQEGAPTTVHAPSHLPSGDQRSLHNGISLRIDENFWYVLPLSAMRLVYGRAVFGAVADAEAVPGRLSGGASSDNASSRFFGSSLIDSVQEPARKDQYAPL